MTKDVPTEKTRITSASPHIAKARSASVLAVSVASSDRDVCFAATCQRGNPAEHSTASSTGLESTAAGAAERDDTSPQKPTTGAGCGGSSDDAISDDDSSSFVPDGSPSNSDLELFDPDEEELDESPPPRQQHALPRFLDQIATPAEGGVFSVSSRHPVSLHPLKTWVRLPPLPSPMFPPTPPLVRFARR